MKGAFMDLLWKVQVRGSAGKPFKYRVTFMWDEAGARLTPLVAANLYAEGDLAVLLEDFGADRGDISSLLDKLEPSRHAEIVVRPSEELLEVLWAS
ncbi:MAG TPA: hypothetical protein VK392_01620 [Thermoanaerobaculia bacterium]|jgi:hypothetical protein|nr:hypothetical protein [Thermoanaerobaculia bacterium]